MTKHNHKTQRRASLQISLEHLEQRLLLATDIPAMEVPDLSDTGQHLVRAEAEPIVQEFQATDFNVGQMQLLPGDTAIGAADGHQIDPEIAQGGNQYLSVWTDYRTSPEDHPGVLTEGLGGDIYGIIMDARRKPSQRNPDRRSTRTLATRNRRRRPGTASTGSSPGGPRRSPSRQPTSGSWPPESHPTDRSSIRRRSRCTTIGMTHTTMAWPIKIASDGQDWVVVFRNT